MSAWRQGKFKLTENFIRHCTNHAYLDPRCRLEPEEEAVVSAGARDGTIRALCVNGARERNKSQKRQPVHAS